MHLLTRCRTVLAIVVGLLLAVGGRTQAGGMTDADVYKALAERMLVTADEVTDPDRRAELLIKAEKAMERYELACERRDRQRQPQAMSRRMQAIANSVARISDSVREDFVELRCQLDQSTPDAALLGDLAIEVNAAIDRGRRKLRLASEGVENLRSARGLLVALLTEHPEIREVESPADSLESLSRVQDCMHSIEVVIHKLRAVLQRVDALREPATGRR
ncbi:MAG: hypothetical protein AAF628_13895 [Planctomycetota bacterium]